MAERVFAMPDLGEGLEEGEIVSWFVAEGDEIELNQPLVEVETAKATVEIPSPFAGRVLSLHAADGDTVPVGAPLVTFDVTGAGSDAGARSDRSTTPRVPTTPAVRKLARDLGIDISFATGSGPGGRVTEDDVRALDRRWARTTVRSERLTPVRRAIAERLSKVAAIPQVTTFRTVECSALEELRGELRVSPLPMVVVALARTIADHPLLNAAWADDAIHVFEAVHVGVATDTERGLVVPVVRNAQELGIVAIANEIRRLAEEARSGRLEQAELRDSTISISNTGSYGSEAGTPLLNPGNAVTLALGVIAARALVIAGEVAARPACTLSLTFDHRVLDGAAVGRGLSDLVERLQSAELLRDLPR